MNKDVVIQLAQQNKKCIDCGAINPQWASVNNASVTMDNWNDDQLKKMRVGGNQKAIEFYSQFPEYKPGMSIKEKYTAQFAEMYREKIAVEADGGVWNRNSFQGGERTRRPLTASNPVRSGSPVVQNYLGPNQKEQNEEYFKKVGEANSQRPSDVHPSQGGKFGGFGNPNYASPSPRDESDPMQMLNQGWNVLSRFGATVFTQGSKLAGEGAKKAAVGAKKAVEGAEVLSQKVSQTVMEGNVGEQVGDYWKKLQRVVAETTNKGAELVSSVLNDGERQGYESLNAGAQGQDSVQTVSPPSAQATTTAFSSSVTNDTSTLKSRKPAKDGWDDEWGTF